MKYYNKIVKELPFPLLITVPPSSTLSPEAGTRGPFEAAVPRDYLDHFHVSKLFEYKNMPETACTVRYTPLYVSKPPIHGS